jgi:hypothetical protein
MLFAVSLVDVMQCVHARAMTPPLTCVRFPRTCRAKRTQAAESLLTVQYDMYA